MNAMNEQEENFFEEILRPALSDADLRAEDIPNIDLYLDQILSLVSDKNAEGSERYRDRILTKTMINNYSKEGLISPIKGKKYNKEQIYQMLLIYSLKNTLTIGEIKRLFGTVEKNGGEEAFSDVWRDYLSMKEESREKAEEITRAIREGCGLDLTKESDLLRLLLALVSLSAYLRTLAETVIDVRFPEKKVVKAQPEKKDAQAKPEKKDAQVQSEKLQTL